MIGTDFRRIEEPPKSEKRFPIAKRRGKDKTDLHLSTRPDTKERRINPIPPRQNPPQADLLAGEYKHNLEQQLYFLEAELRFLRDRSGVDEKPDDPSVDSAIRRLRRARAKQEEETNVRVAEYEAETARTRDAIDAIDISDAHDQLDRANAHESESTENLRQGFVEMASPIHLHQLQEKHYDAVSEKQSELRDAYSQVIAELKARREAQGEDMHKIQMKLDDVRQMRKRLLVSFNESIRNKRAHEEEADILVILGRQEERPPPNRPLFEIKAKSAKLEQEIEASKTNKAELEDQLDRLLITNVRLKAELNDVTAKLERARTLKAEMDRQFSTKLSKTRAENVKLKEELAQLKQQRRDVKRQFAVANQEYDQALFQRNQLQSETDLLRQIIAFKECEVTKLEGQNEITVAEIAKVREEVSMARSIFEDLAKQIAKAAEKLKIVQTRVDLNNEDPRCQMENVPPELEQLFPPLDTVAKKLKETE
jgi:chromosome segregation ATPase